MLTNINTDFSSTRASLALTSKKATQTTGEAELRILSPIHNTEEVIPMIDQEQNSWWNVHPGSGRDPGSGDYNHHVPRTGSGRC